MTDSDLIRAIGESCYGNFWQAAVADALGVSMRTVRRWVAGETCPQPGVWLDLEALLHLREQAIRAIIESEPLIKRLRSS